MCGSQCSVLLAGVSAPTDNACKRKSPKLAPPPNTLLGTNPGAGRRVAPTCWSLLFPLPVPVHAEAGLRAKGGLCEVPAPQLPVAGSSALGTSE